MSTDTVLSHPGIGEPFRQIVDDDTSEVGYVVAVPDGESQPFIVDNDAKATWAMRKLLEHRRELASIYDIAEAEIARIQTWAQEEASKHDRDVAYFEAQLTRYAINVRIESDGKRKSVSTPYGKVSTRTGGEKWVIDDAAFVEWARVEHPDWVRTVEQRAVHVDVLKDVFEVLPVGESFAAVVPGDGDIVPGVTVVPASIKATVEVSA